MRQAPDDIEQSKVHPVTPGSKHPQDDRRTRRSRGIALVAVLWISSLLALLAAGAVSTSRTDLRLAYNLAEQAKARALADAGVHQGLYELLSRPDRQIWRNGAGDREFVLDGGAVRFRLRDEDAKLDLNAASVELFVGLFRAVGLPDEQASAFADRILDFRDEDSDPGPFGAEDEAYIAAGYTAGVADRPFTGVAELTDVLGMTDALYQRIKPHVTVFADVDGIDVGRAAPQALQALPGMTPELAAAMSAQSPETDPLEALPEDIRADVEDYLVPSRDLMFSIESLGISDGDGRFLREAVVALDGGTRRLPFTVYAWKRGNASSVTADGE